MKITITLTSGKQIELEEFEFREMENYFARCMPTLPITYGDKWITSPFSNPYSPVTVSNKEGDTK